MGRKAKGTTPFLFTEGSAVKFCSERAPYRVRAAGARYAVCTKPFNPRKTVVYTVVDMLKDIRGTENLVFGMGAETDGQCSEMLGRLESGETEVSRRNWVKLDVEWVKP